MGLLIVKRAVVAGLLLFSIQLCSAEQTAQSADNAKTQDDAINWLLSLPERSYTLQLATIWGFEECQSAQLGANIESWYCLESSTVKNRYFAVSGSFQSRGAAEQSAAELGVSDFLVNYVPRILKTRCEMPKVDTRYQTFCANGAVAQNTSSESQDINDKAAEAAKQELAAEAPEPSLRSFARPVLFDINSFNVQGENPLDLETTNAVLNRFIGPQKGMDEMNEAAIALEAEFRKIGSNMYGVSYPPQDISDGSVDLVITRYKIGTVTVKGNKHFTDENITRSVPQLRSGESPNTYIMSRSLILANQNSRKRVKLTLEGGDLADEIDATLSVVDRNPVVYSTYINNTGSDSSGNYRVGASVSHSNMFGLDHQTSFTAISSPQDFSELQQYSLTHRIPFYQLGGVLNLFAVKSNIDTGIVSDFFDVAGKGEVFGIGYTKVLPNIGQFRQQLSAQFSDKLTDNDTTFFGEQLLEDLRGRPLSLAYNTSWKNNKGLSLTGSVSAATNLSGGSNNDDFAYESARSGAERSWIKYGLGSSFQYSRNNWLYTGALEFSYSGDRLVAGDQFSMGGSNSVRGMEERELRGDSGVRMTFSVWTPPLAKTLRPILFFDAGYVNNNDPLPGELESEYVSSLGLMLNWNPTARINAALSYGYLIDGIDFDEGGVSVFSRDGDSKAHFNLSYRY